MADKCAGENLCSKKIIILSPLLIPTPLPPPPSPLRVIGVTQQAGRTVSGAPVTTREAASSTARQYTDAAAEKGRGRREAVLQPDDAPPPFLGDHSFKHTYISEMYSNISYIKYHVSYVCDPPPNPDPDPGSGWGDIPGLAPTLY